MQKYALENINPNVRILVNSKSLSCKWKEGHIVYDDVRNGKISLNDASDKLNFKRLWNRITGGAAFDKLFIIEPSVSPVNWLLLSYVATAKEKYVLKNDITPSTTFEHSQNMAHFDKELNSVEDILEML